MNRKINTLLILSFLFVVIVGGSYAYSKYTSNTKGSIDADIAKWNISVNDCNIVNPDTNTNSECFEQVVEEDGETITLKRNFNITDITYDNNGNGSITNNKIGPGSTGYFKLKIRPNDTEVSIKYNLKVSVGPKNDFIKLYRIGPDSDEKILIDEEGYSNVIKYSTDNKNYEDEITIIVDWENDDSNNEYDSAIGVDIDGTNPVLSIPISISFEQFKG